MFMVAFLGHMRIFIFGMEPQKESKMERYCFYDTDIYETYEKNYDISNEEYRTLIKKLCSYSSEISLSFFKGVNFPVEEKFAPFLIKSDEQIEEKSPFVKKYFKVCPELCDLIVSEVNSIFSWIYSFGRDGEPNNPEDISFYRNDGSLLFESITHDGVCFLTPRKNENFEDILSNIKWIKEQTKKSIDFKLP